MNDSSVAVGNLRPTAAEHMYHYVIRLQLRPPWEPTGWFFTSPSSHGCLSHPGSDLGLIQHPGTDGWDPYYLGRQPVHAARHGRMPVGMSVSGNHEVEM
jgi:hypothetical protein